MGIEDGVREGTRVGASDMRLNGGTTVSDGAVVGAGVGGIEGGFVFSTIGGMVGRGGGGGSGGGGWVILL